MSTFDPPFELRQDGCVCGRHRSAAEHDYEAGRQLQCAAAEPEDKRYQGVVASAALRAMVAKAPRGS